MELVGPRISDKPGWHATVKGKNMIIRDFMFALSILACLNRSELALNECLDFKYDESGNVVHAGEASKGDGSGARINHGDRVIADSLAWKLVKLRGIIGSRR